MSTISFLLLVLAIMSIMPAAKSASLVTSVYPSDIINTAEGNATLKDEKYVFLLVPDTQIPETVIDGYFCLDNSESSVKRDSKVCVNGPWFLDFCYTKDDSKIWDTINAFANNMESLGETMLSVKKSMITTTDIDNLYSKLEAMIHNATTNDDIKSAIVEQSQLQRSMQSDISSLYVSQTASIQHLSNSLQSVMATDNSAVFSNRQNINLITSFVENIPNDAVIPEVKTIQYQQRIAISPYQNNGTNTTNPYYMCCYNLYATQNTLSKSQSTQCSLCSLPLSVPIITSYSQCTNRFPSSYCAPVLNEIVTTSVITNSDLITFWIVADCSYGTYIIATNKSMTIGQTFGACAVRSQLMNTNIHAISMIPSTGNMAVSIDPTYLGLDRVLYQDILMSTTIPTQGIKYVPTVNPNNGNPSTCIKYKRVTRWIPTYKLVLQSSHKMITKEVLQLSNRTIVFDTKGSLVLDESDDFNGLGIIGRNCIQKSATEFIYNDNWENCVYTSSPKYVSLSAWQSGLVDTTGLRSAHNHNITFDQNHIFMNVLSDYEYTVQIQDPTSIVCPMISEVSSLQRSCLVISTRTLCYDSVCSSSLEIPFGNWTLKNSANQDCVNIQCNAQNDISYSYLTQLDYTVHVAYPTKLNPNTEESQSALYDLVHSNSWDRAYWEKLVIISLVFSSISIFCLLVILIYVIFIRIGIKKLINSETDSIFNSRPYMQMHEKVAN